MDKNENKGLKPYGSPSTKKTQVELEEGVCAGSATITNPQQNGGINEHKTNNDFKGDFSSDPWDTDPLEQQ